MQASAKPQKHGRVSLLWELSRGSRLLYIAAVLCMTSVILCNYTIPQIIRFTVDCVLGDETMAQASWLRSAVESLGGLESLRGKVWILGLCAVCVSALGGLCNYLRGRSLSRGAEGIVKRLRDRLFDHVQHMPYSWHVSVQTGDIIQRCTSDVEVVRNFITVQMLDILRTLLLVVFAYSILFPMNRTMALASFVFLPMIFCYSFFFLRGVSSRFRKADEAEGLLMSIAQENFTGVRVVRAFGRERHEVDRFDRQNRAFADLWIYLGKLLSVFWGIGDAISGFQLIAICVVGSFQAVQGNITVGGFIVFLLYNSMTIWPVRGLGRTLSEAGKTVVSLGRIKEILDSTPEQDDPDAAEHPVDGDIVFEHVSFSYADQKVLDDISFTVEKGTVLGILGSTGSGKTTVAHLLCRLYDLPPECGKISIGGVPIEKFKRKWLRSNVGIVLQEPFLFSRSIRDNIAALTRGRDIEDVRAAARISCIDESIEQFADGYDTVVGERGVTLSGGQKQRVAIARTIIGNPPVIIFDDSLSAVDTQTDMRIRASLAERLGVGNVTTILIAYRVVSLSQADKIMVLDRGRIVEMGSHDELMSKNGVYRRVHDMQESILEDELSGETE